MNTMKYVRMSQTKRTTKTRDVVCVQRALNEYHMKTLCINETFPFLNILLSK